MNKKITYKQVIADYFYEYVRGNHKGALGLSGFLIVFCIASMFYLEAKNGSAFIPILVALISGDLHRISLPYMMYLVLFSAKEREMYIQKMLRVKVLVPVAFCLAWDSVLLLFDFLPGYVFVLQLVSVLGVTYISGMLKDGSIQEAEEKKVYGSMRGYVGALMVAQQIAFGVMMMICMGEVSRIEFQIVAAILLLIFFPVIIMIRKHWSVIRSNFASYEMVMETEVKNADNHRTAWHVCDLRADCKPDEECNCNRRTVCE